MNTQLYNTLCHAYDYCVREEKYKKECERLNPRWAGGGLLLRQRPPIFALYVNREFKWKKILLWLVLFWPVGVFFLAQYLIPTILSCIKYLLDRANFDYEEYEKEKKANSEKARKDLERLEREWQAFKAENIQYINQIPQNYRRSDYLSTIKFYIQKGQAYTFDQATDLLARDLREIYEEKERAEKERERELEIERRHRETQAKLDAIEANQRKILEEQKRDKIVRIRRY